MKLQTFYLEVALCAKYINFPHCTATIVKMTRILISRKLNLLFWPATILGVQIGSAVLFVEGKRILNAQQIVIKVMA